MSPTDPPYRPIDCSLHDELEAAATRRDLVDVTYAAPEGEQRLTEVQIVDVGARDGAEYLRLSTGVEVRLDRILELNGLPFRPRG